MARIEDIERRLLNWVRWKFGATSGGLGYAAVRYGASTASAGYREAVIPTIDCEAEETDRAVMALDSPLRATVEVVYLRNEPMRRKAARLCCSEATVKARVWEAHRCVSRWLADKAQVRREGAQRLHPRT